MSPCPQLLLVFSKWGCWKEMEAEGKCDQGINLPASFSMGSLGAAWSLDLRSQLLGGSLLCPQVQGPLPLLARHPEVPHWCSLVFRVSASAVGLAHPCLWELPDSQAPSFASLWTSEWSQPRCGRLPPLVRGNGPAGLCEPQTGSGTKGPASTLTLAF